MKYNKFGTSIQFMMKNILFFFLIILLGACNSTKRVEKNLLSGNYYEAIQMTVDQLQKGKDNAKTQDQKLLLQEAFKKYTAKKLNKIDFWTKEDLSKNAKLIYDAYLDLKRVQEQIKPLLPLTHPGKEKPLAFAIRDYSDEILNAQDEYLITLYDTAINELNKDGKNAYRNAYYKFGTILDIDPNFRDVNRLKQEAYQLGLDHVHIKAYNDTGKVIPDQLLHELLDIDTYGLDDLWTVYHRHEQSGLDFDYDIVIAFRSIIFSPERIIEKEESLKDRVEETRYQRDRDGNILRDDNGEKLTYKEEVQVEGTLRSVRQVKSVQVTAKVEYFKLPQDKRLSAYDLNSNFIFENIYGELIGDERVLNEEQLAIVNNTAIPFPSNEKMLLDAGNDIKERLKRILVQNNIGAN